MNQVRIIGGQWRRQLLRFPDSEALRPTPDRVRETLFNWLGQDLTGLRCLDLFAGSGALGFEAASRGAAAVVLVERAPRVLAALRANAARLKCGDAVEIVRADALEFAVSCRQPFDVVFADPPYHQGWADKLAPFLPRLLAADGALYLEVEHPVQALGDWRSVRQGQAGQVHFHLLRQEPRA
ncbi:MAG: 16S rRNA (guanine(966)-N(2))-methyltransferase RsmD [Azovibrio sp.]|nr:16S rRNA (guanine(966)-N(2))-methyltransferase RsmD [Azovibrio sp.]